MNTQQNKIVVLGAGESGCGAALLAMAKGYNVFLSDNGAIQEKYKKILNENNIAFEEGGHSFSLMEDAIFIIKSPAIPSDARIINLAKGRGISIISEIEFAAKFTSSKLIAITGSNGKTTTSSLVFHILKNAGLKVKHVGNVGHSFAKEVIDDEADLYVLELSSFQLDDMYDFKADIAVLLNISPDHLDRYEMDFAKYTESKFRILQNMTSDDYFIYYDGDSGIKGRLKTQAIVPSLLPVSLENKIIDGAYCVDNKIFSYFNGSGLEISTDDVPIKGPHNVIDTMTAIVTAQILNIDSSDIKDGITTFKSIPHRLEKVKVVNEVTFINDSKATNVDSVYYALKSFENPIVLIMGGVDKGNDYSQIEELIQQKVKLLVILGKDNSKILKFFEGKGVEILSTDSLEFAVKESFSRSNPGDVILLSPACASFDLFKNFEDRGDQFKNIVGLL